MLPTTMTGAELSLDDRRIAVWLGILIFVVYAYFYAGGGWNQNSQFDLTRAIVERHTFAIDGYAQNSGDVAYYRGHVYANKAPGLSLLATIPYAAIYTIESRRDVDPSDVNAQLVNSYLCTLVTVALLGALIPAMLYRAARRRGFDALWSATIALIVGLATQLFPYSTLLMVHVPSAALMLFALTTRHRASAGFAAALAVTMNYVCGPALFVLGIAGASRKRFALGALAPLAALLAYQKICFGSPFASSVSRMDPRFVTRGALFGTTGMPSFEALYGITISPYRGLFYFAPVLLMAICGAVVWFRESERSELAAVVAISAIFFAFNVTFNGWEGGFGIGARYLVPVIPMLGLAMLRCRGWMRPLVVALAAISFVINFAAAAVDPQPSATIPRPLTQYILPLLIRGHFSPAVPITPPWSAETFTGHTSVNRMTMDEPVVFLFHPPDSNASEWASFNLGESFFGPGDARSLIPIALVMVIGSIVILRRAATSARQTAPPG